MSRRELWQSLYERFDPERPAEAQWRADRPLSPADRIIELLGIPFGDPRILLMGIVGTGKSTELLRVKEGREREDVVVFLDLASHFSDVVRDSAALGRVSAWEVCFLAGLSLITTLKSKLNYGFPPGDLEELKEAWSAIAKATDTPALPDQDTRVQRMLACVNRLIGQVQSLYRRVLFVIDGLDRIHDLAHAKELFVHSHLISQLACRVVICAPFALRHHLSAAPAWGIEPMVLSHEPVLHYEDPAQPGPGVAFFRELFERRVADLKEPHLISQELLEKLAYHSGGCARDFVKFVRELAQDAWLADMPSATEELVSKVLDRQRRTLEHGLHEGHLRLLEAIASNPTHPLPNSPLSDDLLIYHRLLPYPNQSEWYYPHPLLMMHMVQARRPGLSG